MNPAEGDSRPTSRRSGRLRRRSVATPLGEVARSNKEVKVCLRRQCQFADTSAPLHRRRRRSHRNPDRSRCRSNLTNEHRRSEGVVVRRVHRAVGSARVRLRRHLGPCKLLYQGLSAGVVKILFREYFDADNNRVEYTVRAGLEQPSA